MAEHCPAVLLAVMLAGRLQTGASVSLTVTVHFPSVTSGVVLVYDDAVPETKNSDCS